MDVQPPVKSSKRVRKVVSGLELVCPWSEVVLKGGRIPRHKMPVVVCDNGSLMAYCPNHMLRCFTGDVSTVRRIMESYGVENLVKEKPDAAKSKV
jgi:hypothetical protein